MHNICFRPLSWGPFFNMRQNERLLFHGKVFVPFLGNLFSIVCAIAHLFVSLIKSSSPFSGTFFQWSYHRGYARIRRRFSSPFLGTFFQSVRNSLKRRRETCCFRPLSWGLSFNYGTNQYERLAQQGFRPLSWGLSFNWKRIPY